MNPLTSTPTVMTRNACQIRIRSTAATREPVQAPVPGSGMATKRNSPHFS